MTEKTLTIDKRATRQVRTALRKRQPRETGGILIGCRRGDSEVIVIEAIETPDEYATETTWTLRTAGANRMLTDYLADFRLDTPFGYVGTWHTHPRPDPEPSAIDLATFGREAADNTGLVVMLIFASDRRMTAIVGSSDAGPCPAAIDVTDTLRLL